MFLKRIISGIIVLMCIISFSGCVVLLATGAGALGGYIITKDTIQGDYDVEFSDAWDAARKVSGMLGSVSASDSTSGIVEAMVDRAKVRIEILQLTKEAVRIKVKARKGIFPRIGTAEKVFVKIVQQLMG